MIIKLVKGAQDPNPYKQDHDLQKSPFVACINPFPREASTRVYNSPRLSTNDSNLFSPSGRLVVVLIVVIDNWYSAANQKNYF